jgi:zinc-ribbon domain
VEGHGSTPPPPEPEGEPLPPSGPPRCPHCGAEHEIDQEYCLECGQRLHALGAPGQTIVRRELWSRDSPAWLWATLLALLLVALVAGAIAAIAATRDDERRGGGRPIVTTGPGTTETVDTFTDTSPLTVPTTGAGTTETILPETTLTVPTLTTTTTPTATTTTTPTGSIRSWPAGKDGYTIVLSSTETSRGRDPAERRANDAIAQGLPHVGILNSSDYLTLNPGYYVVFTGVYDTIGQARSNLPTARSFQPLAYVREVTP